MPTKIVNLLTRLWLPILTGILIGTSYIPFPPWAYPFCFVPLWMYWLRQKSMRSVFIGGWVSQFVFTIIGFNWVAHTAHEFGHLPMPVAFLVMLAFASFANLYLPLAGVAWYLLIGQHKTPQWLKLLALACFVSLGDLHLQTVFPWNFGYPWLYSNLPAYHLAEFVGFTGLSMVTIFSNILLLLIWQNRHNKASLATWTAVATALFALINGLGYWRSQSLPKTDRTANVLLVQANIGNLEKQYAEKGWGFRTHILDRYSQITSDGLASSEQVDLVVWPETAFPDNLSNFNSSAHSRRLSNFLRHKGLYLITGGYGRHERTNQSTNSFFLLGPSGKTVDRPYHKTHLLAFGEYLPGAEWFPQLKKWAPQTADFARGPGPVSRHINGFDVGPQICYEVLFPIFSKKLADLGVQLFVNLTNDSWYGKWQEPYQHLYMSAARAVEFRRPLVRSTNTGFTTVALASGEVLELSPLHKEWYRVFSVPYYSQPMTTLFQKYFWFIPSVVWFLTLLVVLASRVILKSNSSKQENG